MKTLQRDVAIIGAGSAGLNARREVANAGLSVILIEAGAYGTTCARVGCMPSKLLIAAADAAHHVHQAERFGVKVDPGAVQIDGPAVFDRVRRERDRFVGFVVESTEGLPEAQRLMGYARFIGPTTLQVDDHTIVEASRVVIATGSRPWIPPDLDPIKDQVMVNDDVFELEDVPNSVAVFGTGIIGLELGQALRRLGAEVTFFNPFDALGPFTDPELAARSREALGTELDLQLGAQIIEVVPEGEGAQITWEIDGERHTASFERVLASAGRRANVDQLGLEAVPGIPRDERGRIITDPRTTQLGELPIFLAGDANGHRPLLHEASDEGRIAGANAVRFPDVAATQRRTSLAVAFTDPQMALVGDRYADLDPADIEIGQVDYRNQGRARVMGVNEGLVRIYGRKRDCRVVGAEMFGPAVEHTAHLLAWVVQQGLTVNQVLRMPFYHPVVEEGIRTALRDLSSKLKVTGWCPPDDRATAPGM